MPCTESLYISMYLCRFVVGMDGELVGVVSLMSICYELLRIESELSTNEMIKLDRNNSMN